MASQHSKLTNFLGAKCFETSKSLSWDKLEAIGELSMVKWRAHIVDAYRATNFPYPEEKCYDRDRKDLTRHFLTSGSNNR
jgi:hypothetical protein